MAEKKIANRKRLDFSKIPATIKIPNLIEVQKRSYERFLQMDKLPSERDDAGARGPATWAPPATAADRRWSPIRSIPAKCFACAAAPTTPTPRTSAPSAAIRWLWS